MNTMRSAVQDLAGATSPLDELIPALKGREHAQRLYRLQAEEELDEEERQFTELFFDLSLELITEKLAAVREELNLKTADMINAVYDEDAVARAYTG
jgi:hypothetical protein